MVISFHLSNIFSLSLSFPPHFFFSFLSFLSPSSHLSPFPCLHECFFGGVRQAEGLSLPPSAVFILPLSPPLLAERHHLQAGWQTHQEKKMRFCPTEGHLHSRGGLERQLQELHGKGTKRDAAAWIVGR